MDIKTMKHLKRDIKSSFLMLFFTTIEMCMVFIILLFPIRNILQETFLVIISIALSLFIANSFKLKFDLYLHRHFFKFKV